LPVKGCSIVHFGENGALADVVVLGGSLMMEKAASKFKVHICERPMGVGGADQELLDRRGKGACQRSGGGQSWGWGG